MLTRLYIEALLVEEELADLVWEASEAGEIDDLAVCVLWTLVWIAYEAGLLYWDDHSNIIC